MKKKLTALEELRKKLRDEHEALTREADSASHALTADEIKLFIQQTVVPAFEQIKQEIEPYVIKIRIQKYKYTAGFYITETASNYYCHVRVTAQAVVLKSTYTFPVKARDSRIRNCTIKLPSEEGKFQKLSEITPEKIIELFNHSFFSRVIKMQEYIQESMQSRYFDDTGEIPNPFIFD